MRSNLKCNKKCDAFRIEAKELKKNSQNFEAIETLNKALCHAATDDKKSLIYVDRAAICCELKFYEKCIANISLTGLENCSVNALNESCIKARKNEKPRDRDDEEISKFFSITTAKNPKIPFVAECLKLQESWKFGRGIFANNLIKTGEILVVEKPFFKILNKDVRYKRCANCLRSNTATLIPCDKYCVSSEYSCTKFKLLLISQYFSKALYCDERCKNEAWKNYHSEECKTLEVQLENNEYDLMIKKILFESLALFDKNIAKMRSFLSDAKNQTAYDFDFSEGGEKEKSKKYLKSIFALRGAINSEEDKEMSEWLIQNDPAIKSIVMKRDHADFLKSFMLRIMGILDRNSYIFYDLKSSTTDEEIGSGILAYASLFNHSCSPNLFRFFIDGHQVYIAKKPIEKNQQLFVGYM